MLFNTAIAIDTSTNMKHNISTSTVLPLLVLFMIKNTLGAIATIHAHNSIITPSTTTIIEIKW